MPARARMDDLQLLLERLTRPLNFASRSQGKPLATIKNLGQFVSGQVIQALADQVFPQAVEADLLALRQLFLDFDDCLEASQREARVAEARAVLMRLRSRPSTEGHGKKTTPATVDGPIAAPQGPIWDLPIRFTRGVGPARAALLEKLGVRNVEEALWYLPWRYEDRSQVTPIRDVRSGALMTVYGAVSAVNIRRTRNRRLTLCEVTVLDRTGSIRAVFFNQPYLEKVFAVGTRVMLSGVVSVTGAAGSVGQMDSPQFELLENEMELPLHVGRIVPIYHETKGLTSRVLRAMMRGLLDAHADAVPEILPDDLRARLGVPLLREALQDVHFPTRGTDPGLLDRGSTPAHRRLAFEELFLLELALALRQQTVKREEKPFRFDPAAPLVTRLQQVLRFRLTASQERVWQEIAADMASPHPMNRLLQGDVGCGKTVVALHAMLMACGSGYQAALMVPTEILAEQHYRNLRGWLDTLGVQVALLKGGGKDTSRRAAIDAIAKGTTQIVVGTHALIQKSVSFAKLGVAVIDEQHRFGVLQRKMFVEKGYRPDVLVMTATPIPRTLAMTAYGDLDVSVIDELPAGRKPAYTLLFNGNQRRRAYSLLRDEVRAGRQAYIVYPLIEESEKVDLQAAIQAAERLKTVEFPDLTIGLLHGRMRGPAKEAVMEAFKAGSIQIMVTTTVIEVGVDIGNATVMVIEHAERFGLAQLHQLRGRVGRSSLQSYCLLIASDGKPRSGQGEARRGGLSRERLEALVQSTDGFVIAEEDLRLRGPGEFFGVRQWGLPEFRAANLIRDAKLLEVARREARTLLEGDPTLSQGAHRAARETMLRRWQAKLDLAGIS